MISLKIGVDAFFIKLDDGSTVRCHYSKDYLARIEERILIKIRSRNQNEMWYFEQRKLPAIEEFFRFFSGENIQLDLLDSGKFQKTCEYFELRELITHVNNHFGNPGDLTGHPLTLKLAEYESILRTHSQPGDMYCPSITSSIPSTASKMNARTDPILLAAPWIRPDPVISPINQISHNLIDLSLQIPQNPSVRIIQNDQQQLKVPHYNNFPGQTALRSEVPKDNNFPDRTALRSEVPQDNNFPDPTSLRSEVRQCYNAPDPSTVSFSPSSKSKNEETSDLPGNISENHLYSSPDSTSVVSNPINMLQELTVRPDFNLGNPRYDSERGNDHVFEVKCIVDNAGSTSAFSPQEAQAKREAAKKMVEKILHRPIVLVAPDTVEDMTKALSFFYNNLKNRKGKHITAFNTLRDDPISVIEQLKKNSEIKLIDDDVLDFNKVDTNFVCSIQFTVVFRLKNWKEETRVKCQVTATHFQRKLAAKAGWSKVINKIYYVLIEHEEFGLILSE